MSAPSIIYSSKTIVLTDAPFVHSVTPTVMRTSHTTLSGAVETLLVPRMDIQVHVEFRTIKSSSLRVQLNNFWQWASQGNSWSIALDGSKTANTTVSVDATAGGNVIQVASMTGITVGNVYKLIDGPNYQLIVPSSIAGGFITADALIDADFSVGALLRDEFYFPAVIRDNMAPSPIQEIASESPEYQTWPPTRFRLSLDFFESVG